MTQICIAYMLISTYSWYVKFEINVCNNIKTNVAISQYKADIAYTCWKQLILHSIIQLPFAILRYTWKIKQRQFRLVLKLA